MENSKKNVKRVWLLSGVPGSGKSTWVKKQIKNEYTAWCSRDAVRFSMVKEDENYFKRENEVFDAWIKDINEAIKNPCITDIYVDATHLNDRSRRKTLDRLSGNFDLIHVIFKVPLEICLKRNSFRKGREEVPEKVIRNMYSSFRNSKIKGKTIFINENGEEVNNGENFSNF